MYRWIITFILATLAILTACQANQPTVQIPASSPAAHTKKSGPPPIEVATFEVPHKRIQTIHHIYCWNAEACPEYKFMQREDQIPVTEVEPGQLVKIRFPKPPKPSSIQVFIKPISQRIYAPDEVAFSAPIEEGAYTYSVMVTWQTGKKGGMVEYFFRLAVAEPKRP